MLETRNRLGWEGARDLILFAPAAIKRLTREQPYGQRETGSLLPASRVISCILDRTIKGLARQCPSEQWDTDSLLPVSGAITLILASKMERSTRAPV